MKDEIGLIEDEMNQMNYEIVLMEDETGLMDYEPGQSGGSLGSGVGWGR